MTPVTSGAGSGCRILERSLLGDTGGRWVGSWTKKRMEGSDASPGYPYFALGWPGHASDGNPGGWHLRNGCCTAGRQQT